MFGRINGGPVGGLREVTLGGSTVSCGWSELGFQALLGVGFLGWHTYVGKGAAVLQSGVHAVAGGGAWFSTFKLLTVVISLVVVAASRAAVVGLTCCVVAFAATVVVGGVVVHGWFGLGSAGLGRLWVDGFGVMDLGNAWMLRSSVVSCGLAVGCPAGNCAFF